MSMRVEALVLACFAIASFVALSSSPIHAQGQPAGKVYRIGFLRQGQPPQTFVEAFQQGLRERGYVDGHNVIVEFRFTDGSLDQLSQLAEELVRLKVDVILASAASAAVAAKKGTLKRGDATFDVPGWRKVEIKGDNIILGSPVKFTKENIDQFDF